MTKKKVNWEAVSAIGQVISCVAVALTLFYLTAQVRYAKVAASDANRLVRSSGVVSFFLTAAQDPEFRRASLAIGKNDWFISEISRRLELTQDEATQLHATANYWFWLHWGQWGTTMEERDRRELRSMIQRFYSLPHVRLIWEGQRLGMDPGFVEFVEEALAEVERDPSLGPVSADQAELMRRLDELGIGVPSTSAAGD